MDARKPDIAIDIGPGAIARFASYCAAAGGPVRLVADANTWKAAGLSAARELSALGAAYRATVLDEPYLAADARSILRLLSDDEPGERLYAAVGSGTICDIVRFVCHRTGRGFVCLATAPSVDAYSSVVAPIVVDGMKRTFAAKAPAAVFADTEVLALAPRAMIASGFGDMLCKHFAVADWRLGALFWGEPFDEAIARRSLAAAESCARAASEIGAGTAEGVAVLAAALVESGLCMAEAGHSRPASGAEHQYSHFWEMRLLREGRPPILHGLKVAIGSLESARLWDGIRGLSKAEAKGLLDSAPRPERAEEEARIRRAYGPDAAEVIAGQERFLSMGGKEREELNSRLLGAWETVLGLASSVPSFAETSRLLAAAGCPSDARSLGLGEEEISLGLESAHYLRDRFTVKKLSLALANAAGRP